MKFGNENKKQYLHRKGEEARVESEIKCCSNELNDISSRLKFNLSYFNPETPGYDFSNLKLDKLQFILMKIKEYSRSPISYWQSIDNYAKYGAFPSHSEFDLPENVPSNVEWGRFRIGSRERIIGFTIPQKHHGKIITLNRKNYYLDYNTFYFVFLDLDHKFYPTKRKGK